MVKAIGYTVLLMFLVVSCTPREESSGNEGIPVARVFDKVLYEKDVFQAIPSDASSEDSTSIRNSVINSWINQALMVRQAELNLPEKQMDVEKKLEKYRQDLLIFSYQNQLLIEKLDTIVSNQEIDNYYVEHQEMFQLVDYIVKARYIKLDSVTFKNKKVRNWLMSNSEEDFEDLEAFCYMHSANFFLEDSWMYFDELVQRVPIVTYNKEKLLKNKKLIELYDDGFLYLVRIVDYKLKDSTSPMELERNNIKRIILNNRKLEFLDDLSVDIYQNAKNNQEIEIYIP